jgi:hypothetical protein
LALDEGHGLWAMRGADNSFGFGAGIFVLAGTFMLYRIFFWHD